MKKNIKRLNIVVILFLIFLLFLIQPSFSYFKLTKENPDAIVLETVELSYTITSSSLNNNQITVSGNSIQQIVIELVSGNSRKTEYEVYYQTLSSLKKKKKKNITVNCIGNESEGLPSGTISSSGTKEGGRNFPCGQKQLYYTDKKWDNPAESGAVRDICVFLPPGRGRDGAYPDRVQIPSPAALPEGGGLRSHCEQ